MSQEYKETRLVLVTHYHPDLDACFCLWLLNTFGFRHFGEAIKRAIFKFVSVNQMIEDYVKGEVLYKHIHADCGKTDYDHRHNSGAVVTSADKIALDLGINNPAVLRLLSIIRRHDLNGTSVSDVKGLDLFTINRGFNHNHPDNPEAVAKLTFPIFDALYANQGDIIQAEQDYRAIRFTQVSDNGGNPLFNIGSVASGSENMVPVARMLADRDKKHLDVVIVQDSEGRARILKSANSKVSMKLIAFFVRKAEITASDLRIRLSREELKAEGEVKGIPHWFLFKFKQLINGGPKNPDAPVTELNLGQLLGCVVNALKEQIRIEKFLAEKKAKEELETSTKTKELAEEVSGR